MSPPPPARPARFVALHGLPTSPALWDGVSAHIPLVAPALRGLATAEPRADWSLASFVAELRPHLDGDTILVGHDLGGVVAALAAAELPLRALVLTGTALGPYWAPVRLTARAPLHHFFYERHGGRRFLTGAVSQARRADVLTSFPPIDALAARMRSVAREMRPPPNLAGRIRCPVHLLWGREDRWYPAWVARAVARGTRGALSWLPGGHLTMWEHPSAYAAALRTIERG